MYDYLKHIPCGTSIPFDNPHAVSVSLPTICDVIKYEEADKEILEKMKSGYPRFFRNRLVQQLVGYIKKEKQIPENYLVVPISSLKAYTILCEMLNVKLNFIELSNGVFLLIKSDDKLLKIINDYIRNAGLIISSRQAEKILFDLGLISQLYKEERKKLSEANKNIYKILTQAYNVTHEHIVLTNSGANAVFSVCEAIIQKNILEEKKALCN